jgi:hypothetical protein
MATTKSLIMGVVVGLFMKCKEGRRGNESHKLLQQIVIIRRLQ